MGKEAAVYATPRMVSDVEYACRDLLLEHLDAGEDSVGAHVSIDHLAPTPMGMKVTVEVKIEEVDRRKVVFDFSVKDIEEVGRGTARALRRGDRQDPRAPRRQNGRRRGFKEKGVRPLLFLQPPPAPSSGRR